MSNLFLNWTNQKHLEKPSQNSDLNPIEELNRLKKKKQVCPRTQI